MTATPSPLAAQAASQVLKGKIVQGLPLNQLNAGTAILEVLAAGRQCLQTVQTEQTKRAEITARERAALATIRSHRKLALTFLDLTFDERRHNFNRLFDALETAIATGQADVSPILESITALASKSPFADLQDAETLAALFKTGNHVMTV